MLDLERQESLLFIPFIPDSAEVGFCFWFLLLFVFIVFLFGLLRFSPFVCLLASVVFVFGKIKASVFRLSFRYSLSLSLFPFDHSCESFFLFAPVSHESLFSIFPPLPFSYLLLPPFILLFLALER